MQASFSHKTYSNGVDLGQQFGIILLHGFQTLKHCSHMRLTKQKGIIWQRYKKRDAESVRGEETGEQVNTVIEEQKETDVRLFTVFHELLHSPL